VRCCLLDLGRVNVVAWCVSVAPEASGETTTTRRDCGGGVLQDIPLPPPLRPPRLHLPPVLRHPPPPAHPALSRAAPTAAHDRRSTSRWLPAWASSMASPPALAPPIDSRPRAASRLRPAESPPHRYCVGCLHVYILRRCQVIKSIWILDIKYCGWLGLDRFGY
jgi:hypothetical protein